MHITRQKDRQNMRWRSYLSIKISRNNKRFLASLKLRKIDSVPVHCGPSEIFLFMIIRNESLRLPYIFKYYLSKGIDRIFVIDNASTDDSVSFLLSQKNTHVFQTNEKYACQPIWLDLLLRRYGRGHWCLVADADELFIYPCDEKLTLHDLSLFLEDEGSNALDCVLLDMYSDKPLKSICYKRSSDPLESVPYFDRSGYYQKKWWTAQNPWVSSDYIYSGIARTYGGVRKRVFGIEPCLSKFAFFKFKPCMFFSAGTHFAEGISPSKLQGALLHFKFLNDFPDVAIREAKREQYWKAAIEYKAYAAKLRRNPVINFYYNNSIRFDNSAQLVGLGIIKTTVELDMYASNLTNT